MSNNEQLYSSFLMELEEVRCSASEMACHLSLCVESSKRLLLHYDSLIFTLKCRRGHVPDSLLAC
uniref:Uncharacterized protein n=1 Tax=Nelumbo nucifera TaxID=4432 RepID=A0A823A0G9_NELNU|nr:TPA_asm: hypothetical protein HUJ06_018756 [Nelumbo nucifera]